MKPIFALGIDGGPELSGWSLVVARKVAGEDSMRLRVSAGLSEFGVIKHVIRDAFIAGFAEGVVPIVAYEKMAAMGMPASGAVMDTAEVNGRIIEFLEATQDACAVPILRREVKVSLCGVANAKSKNIRQSLIDIIGPTRIQIYKIGVMNIATGKVVKKGFDSAESAEEWIDREHRKEKALYRARIDGVKTIPNPAYATGPMNDHTWSATAIAITAVRKVVDNFSLFPKLAVK